MALMIAAVSPAHAQLGGFSTSSVNAAFLELLGTNTSFSATVDVRVLDKDGKDWVRLPLKLAVLDQNILMDVDITKTVSRDLPELAMNSLKQAGMGQLTTITRPDKQLSYLIYPGAKSYVTMPLSAEESQVWGKGYKVQKETLGKELLAGKERTKQSVVVRDAKGAVALQATTWNAAELKNFPVQIQMQRDSMTVTMRFNDLKLEKPSATQFEIPSGLKEYKNMQEMTMDIMKKMASGGGN